MDSMMTNPCGIPGIEVGFEFRLKNREYVIFDFSENVRQGFKFYYAKRM